MVILKLQLVALKTNGHANEEKNGEVLKEMESPVKYADSADSGGAGQVKVRDSTFPHGECHRASNGGQSGLASTILHPANKPCGKDNCKEDGSLVSSLAIVLDPCNQATPL